MIRKSVAVWTGTGLQGGGAVTTQSGALQRQPYSFKTRFQSEDGKAGTNPEELLGAALAACYAMTVSFVLADTGHTAEKLSITAAVDLSKVDDGFAIKSIALELEGDVPGMDAEAFRALAENAKKACPVSKALAATPITLAAKLS
jgi:osmotically inducible protein OsmC